MTDAAAHNRAAWDGYVAAGNRWTLPVDAATVARARAGDWQIVLTPETPVPRDWFGDLGDVLCLASGGGQQGPVLAAAGARVTVLDASPGQLARDREVAAREGLEIRCIEADMRDLPLPDAAFDLIVHPVSNVFCPEIRPVWRECARVLRPGGRLMAGWCNPDMYALDLEALDTGAPPLLQFARPYSDLDLPAERLSAQVARGDALEFAHSFDDQIGGQLAAGFALIGFYSDNWGGGHPVDRFMPPFFATLAVAG